MEKILDLGCGKNKRPGSIGLDMNPGVHPDVLHEVKRGIYLPFIDNSFDRVCAMDFIEHVDNISWLLSEVHRVSKPGAVVEIRYPHYSHKCAYSDVTHVHRLGLRSLDHFDPSTECGRKYAYYRFFWRNFPFKIESLEPDFSNTFRGKISKVICSILGQGIYESYIAVNIPINNVELKMRVIKTE